MPRFLETWRESRRRARERREARALLRELFRDPEALAGTSLNARHRSRWVYLEHEIEDGEIARVIFGILRHPRPYAFSSQSHKVIEYYVLDARERKVIRQRGHNVTREEGRDAD